MTNYRWQMPNRELDCGCPQFVICNLSFVIPNELQASLETLHRLQKQKGRRSAGLFSNLSVPLLRGRGWFTLFRLNNAENELVGFDMHLDGFAGLDVAAQQFLREGIL